MKWFLITAAVFGFSLVTGCQAAADSVASPAAGKGVAVIELFSSEGCSSCPPADALAAKIEAEGDARVFVIAQHVDYWDDLGWTDPFGSAVATNRQHAYADALKLRGVYTPQMVVNGRTEFTGSNADKARAAIAGAVAKPADVSLTLSASAADSKVKAKFDAGKKGDGVEVHVVLVRRSATSNVGRGENGGKTLTHVNVAAAWETRTEDHGEVTFNLPAGVAAKDVRVIAFAQNIKTMRVHGAVAADVVVR